MPPDQARRQMICRMEASDPGEAARDAARSRAYDMQGGERGTARPVVSGQPGVGGTDSLS